MKSGRARRVGRRRRRKRREKGAGRRRRLARRALEQARFQFWFSIGAATIGFAWIITAGAMALNSDSSARLLQVAPGIILDAVAFLFFRQAEETCQRATALYDRLRTDYLKTQAISIVDSIEDTKLRSAIRGQLALHIVGMSPGSFEVGRFLESPSGPDAQLLRDPPKR